MVMATHHQSRQTYSDLIFYSMLGLIPPSRDLLVKSDCSINHKLQIPILPRRAIYSVTRLAYKNMHSPSSLVGRDQVPAPPLMS